MWPVVSSLMTLQLIWDVSTETAWLSCVLLVGRAKFTQKSLLHISEP